MIFLVEDISMAVITGAGAEYGETRTKNLHIFIQIHKPLSDVFASIYQNTDDILLLQIQMFI